MSSAAPSAAYLLGIDVGTGSVKTELVRDDGTRWARSSEPYRLHSPHPGWAEQDPQDWWDAVTTAVGDVWRRAGTPTGAHVTVGLTGQMHTTVLLDASRDPVRPAVLWCDTRAEDQARAIAEAVPDVADRTGNTPLAAFTLPHLLWLREHDPERFARARSVVMPKDVVRERLTGTLETDWTDASGTGALDTRTRTWSDEVLRAVALDRALLPRVRAPHEIVGAAPDLLPGAARVDVAVGVGDQFAEALSVGLVDPGALAVVLGTSGVVLGAQDAPSVGAFCHAPDDRWLRLESMHAAGMSLTWFRDSLAPDASIDQLLAEAAAAPAGSAGLLYLPFLVGDRSSHGASARAAFVGARPDHTRGHFVRAVLEGVAMELKHLADERMRVGDVTTLWLKGGGARSPLWAQIVADVFGVPVRVTSRSAASGAAAVAGVAAGWWDYHGIPDEGDGRVHEPHADARRRYDDVRGDYQSTVGDLHDDPARR